MFDPQRLGHLSTLASICLAIIVRLRDVIACAGACYTSESDATAAQSQRSCILHLESKARSDTGQAAAIR